MTRSNWTTNQQLIDQFWKRWVREYLPTIARRTKWFNECDEVKVNDLVVVVYENQRNGWARGRVLSVIPGRDGRIRQAMVQTSGGVFRRPVSKLAVLQMRDMSNAQSSVNPEVRYGPGDVADTGNTDDTDIPIRKAPRTDSVYATNDTMQNRLTVEQVDSQHDRDEKLLRCKSF